MRMVKPEDLKEGDIIGNPEEPYKRFYRFIEMYEKKDRGKLKCALVYLLDTGEKTEMIFNRDIPSIETDEEFVFESHEIKLLHLGK